MEQSNIEKEPPSSSDPEFTYKPRPLITELPDNSAPEPAHPPTESRPLLQNLCPICHINLPIYTCPACETRSCSLQCSQKHKAQMSCTGEVDPSKYRSRSALLSDEHQLNRDYNFIQRIDRRFHVSLNIISEKMPQPKRKRGPMAPGGRGPRGGLNSNNANFKRQRLPTQPSTASTSATPQLFNRNMATVNGVHIYQLPPSLSRAMLNRTGYSGKKTKYWAWTIEWMYKDDQPKTDEHKDTTDLQNGNLLGSLLTAGRDALDEKDEEKKNDAENLSDKFSTKVSHNIPETELLGETAVRYLHLNPRKRVKIQELEDNTKADGNSEGETDAVIAARYNYYLKKVHTPANAPVAILLDGTKSIHDSLQNRSVVEFPTIFVIAKDSTLPEHYTILTPEEDDALVKKNSKESDSSDSSSSDSDDDSDNDSDSDSDDSSDDSSSDDSSSDDDDDNDGDDNDVDSNGETDDKINENKNDSPQPGPIDITAVSDDDDDDEPPEESSSKPPANSLAH